MTHRFDDDGGNEYDDFSGDWEFGTHNNPCLLSNFEPRICCFCSGKGKVHGIDINTFKKTPLEKCKSCRGTGYR